MSAEKIAAVRAKFEEEVKQNGLLYHPIDIERVRTEEWQVKRYLLDSNDDVEIAFQKLIKTLQWKKEIGVHELTEQSFPREFYQLYKFEIYGTEKEGRLLLWESYRHQKVFEEIAPLLRKFVAFALEKADRLGAENGFTHMADYGKAGISNVDVGLSQFRVDCVTTHYPGALRRIAIIDLPFLLKPVIKLIISFMSPTMSKVVEFHSSNQLANLVSKDQIHEEMGGTRRERHYPENTLSLKAMAKDLALSDAFVQKFYDYYKNVL